MLSRNGIVFLANSCVFNVTYGMVTLLVPLYTSHLGYSLLEIGVIVSVIGYTQLVVRVSSGVVSDWLGERLVLVVGSASLVVAGLFFLAGSASIWILVVAQVFAGLGRACFWSPAQAHASRLHPTSIRIGSSAFNAITNAGYLVGMVAAGLTPGILGYPGAMAVFTALSVLSTILWFGLAEHPRETRASEGLRDALVGLGEMARVPALYVSGVFAFMAGGSIALVGSFYPLYATRNLDVPADLVGFVTAARIAGSIVGTLLFARQIRAFRERDVCAGLIVLFGLTILAVQWVPDALSYTLLLFVTGILVGGIALYNITMAARYSDPRRRGVAMAFTGLFWSLALVVVPVGFGALATVVPLGTAFLIGGLVVVAIGLAMIPLYSLCIDRAGVDRVASAAVAS